MMIDWTAVESGACTAIVTACGVIYWIKQHLPQIKKDVAEVKSAVLRLGNNQAAQEAVADAEQAAALPTGVDPALRDALLNKAVREALAAFKIEAGTLGETYRDGIIQYATSVVPDVVKPFVPQLLDATLQAIQSGNTTAQNHPAILAVKTLKSVPNQIAQTVPATTADGATA